MSTQTTTTSSKKKTITTIEEDAKTLHEKQNLIKEHNFECSIAMKVLSRIAALEKQEADNAAESGPQWFVDFIKKNIRQDKHLTEFLKQPISPKFQGNKEGKKKIFELAYALWHTSFTRQFGQYPVYLDGVKAMDAPGVLQKLQYKLDLAASHFGLKASLAPYEKHGPVKIVFYEKK